jgi:hypothetical protein
MWHYASECTLSFQPAELTKLTKKTSVFYQSARHKSKGVSCS